MPRVDTQVIDDLTKVIQRHKLHVGTGWSNPQDLAFSLLGRVAQYKREHEAERATGPDR